MERTQETASDVAVEGGALMLWFYKLGICNQKMHARAPGLPLTNLVNLDLLLNHFKLQFSDLSTWDNSSSCY